ncbi:hypothetical protein [Rhizobium leguminosarum]|uniref:hypothetical protein n=1 Tax=Rhizobium leguminosarum TaxID=384 RepID=UPI002E1317C2|nr:hypothetical protein U8Q02_42130 [Rhizobium leguminosarum]
MAAASRKEPLIARIKAFVPEGETRRLSAVAQALRVSQKAVEEEVDGSYEGVCLNVGIRVGSGAARLPRSAWEVEHYQA